MCKYILKRRNTRSAPYSHRAEVCGDVGVYPAAVRLYRHGVRAERHVRRAGGRPQRQPLRGRTHRGVLLPHRQHWR